MRFNEILGAGGGIARWRDFAANGFTHRQLRAAVEAGWVKRHYRGCYSWPEVPRELVLARYYSAAVTCVSAADALGLRMLAPPDLAHLELHSGRGGHTESRAGQDVCVHRLNDFEPGEDMVSATRAIDVATRCVTPREQLVMIDHALARGLMTLDDITTFSLTHPRTRLWLRTMADASAESASETCARVAMVEEGLSVQSQAPFGANQRADFLVEKRLYVELDGYEHHKDREAFGNDRARDRFRLVRGRPTMRFTYHDAVERPDELVRDVMLALDAPLGAKLAA